MKILVNILFFNILFLTLLTILETFILSITSHKFEVINFIFIFINFFILLFLLTLIVFPVKLIFKRFSLKISHFFLDYDRTTKLILTISILTIYLLLLISILFIFVFPRIENTGVFSIIMFSFYIFLVVFLIYKFSVFFWKRLDEFKLSNKVSSFLFFIFILSMILLIIVIVAKAYSYNILYVVEAFYILLYIIFLFFYSPKKIAFLHYKLIIIIISLAFFINSFKLFETKFIDLKKISSSLDEQNLISDNITNLILNNFFDKDGDGFYRFLSYGDCNDRNPNINPFAEDIPNNSIDENCNGFDDRDLYVFKKSSDERYKYINLNYKPKLLVIFLNDFTVEDKLNLKKMFNTNHSLIYENMILETPNSASNIKNFFNVKMRGKEKILSFESIIMNFNESKIIKIIEKSKATETFVIPISLNSRGENGYISSNNSIYMDQILSMAVIYSKKRTYSKRNIKKYISLLDLSYSISQILNKNVKRTYFTSLIDEILFDSHENQKNSQINLYFENDFKQILEVGIIKNNLECIKNLRRNEISCLNLENKEKVNVIDNLNFFIP